MTEKYEFVDAEYVTLAGDEALAPTITQMCEWLGVSKSGYYDWMSRPQSETEKRREILKLKISALFEANNEEYGYRRMTEALRRGGEQADDETVPARSDLDWPSAGRQDRCPDSRSSGSWSR